MNGLQQILETCLAGVPKLVFAGMIREWSNASEEKIASLLQSAAGRVVIDKDQIQIQLGTRAVQRILLGNSFDERAGTEDICTIETAAQLKRCGGEVRLLLPPDAGNAAPYDSAALIRAMARAHDWVDRIVRGEIKNQRRLAEETGLDERYISRLISLAFLSPDLTEAILEGRQSAELSLENFVTKIPLDWGLQRHGIALTSS